MKGSLFIISALILASFTAYYFGSNLSFKQEKNHERLAKIAKEVNDANLTWKAGENSRFVDSDLEGVLGSLGAILDNNHGINVSTINNVALNIPDSFDSRTKWG